MFFFFNDTATTEIYTLSLHDALPICLAALGGKGDEHLGCQRRNEAIAFLGELRRRATILLLKGREQRQAARVKDRKSTRLNSSHQIISYAVFCLKKKKHAT